MTRHIKRAHKRARRSKLGQMVTAVVLISAGLAAITLGSETIASLLVMAGLTLGGWSKGLHTPAPCDDEEAS